MVRKFQFIRWIFELVLGSGIILFMLMLGNFISAFTGDLISGAIVGMLLLTLSLQLGIVRLHWVRRITKLFESWMSLLFVPIGVGLVEHMDKLQSILPAILLTCVVGTLLLLALVGHIIQWLEQKADTTEMCNE